MIRLREERRGRLQEVGKMQLLNDLIKTEVTRKEYEKLKTEWAGELKCHNPAGNRR